MSAEAHDLGYLQLTLEERRPARRATLRAVDVEKAVGFVEGIESARRWLAEVADLPARLIGGLPRLTLRMRAVDGATFHFTTSALDREILEETGAVVLDGGEWEGLILAAEADRAWPADLVRCLRVRGTDGRLSTEAMLDGVTVEQARRDAGSLFSLGRVLERLGVRLDLVSMEDATGEATFP